MSFVAPSFGPESRPPHPSVCVEYLGALGLIQFSLSGGGGIRAELTPGSLPHIAPKRNHLVPGVPAGVYVVDQGREDPACLRRRDGILDDDVELHHITVQDRSRTWIAFRDGRQSVEEELWGLMAGISGSLADELLTERREEAKREAPGLHHVCPRCVGCTRLPSARAGNALGA